MMTRWLYEKHMINLPCTDPEIEITRHSQMDLTVVIPVNNHHHPSSPPSHNQKQSDKKYTHSQFIHIEQSQRNKNNKLSMVVSQHAFSNKKDKMIDRRPIQISLKLKYQVLFI